MNNEKIGIFIAKKRKEKNLTQEQLGEKLGISKNAISKWERGICWMDMSLLIPLSEILEVNVIDILSGEIVRSEDQKNKYEDSLKNIIKLNEMESKAFGLKGLIIIYILICVFNCIKGITSNDIISMILMFISFKMYYKYKRQKEKKYLTYSIVSFLFSLFLIIIYIIESL